MSLTVKGAAVGAVLLVAHGALHVSRAQAPMTIDAALAQPSFQSYAPLALSPDGAWVAFTLMNPTAVKSPAAGSWFTSAGTPSTATGARVRITHVRTGRTLPVANESAASWGPSWSPDGQYLAFYSDADGTARLWVRETATGRTRRVSDAIIRGHRAFEVPRWTPDSRSVITPILPYGSALPEAARRRPNAGDIAARQRDSATVNVMRADSSQRYGGQFSGGRSMDNQSSLQADLARVSIATGAVRTLAHGYRPLEYAVAPNGRFVVFTSERPAILRPRWTVPYDVVVVPLGSPKPEPPRVVAAGVPLTYIAKSVLWSPDGITLLYSATDSTGRTHLFAADSGDWRPREVATSNVGPPGIDSTAGSGQTAWWDENGRTFYVLGQQSVIAVSMPDGVVRSIARLPNGHETLTIVGPQSRGTARSEGGRSLVVAIRNDSTKREGFARLDLASGAWRILMDEDRHLGQRHEFAMDVTNDGRMVFLSEDARHPTDVWVTDRDLAAPRQLTHVAPEMNGVAFGETRLIDFTTASGAARRATLLLPAGYRSGVRYPLVVYPYPVLNRSNDVNIFGVTGSGVENMQLLATRGFAVLAPDVSPFDWKDQLRDLASIVQRGVDRVIELGIADSTRLGIMGHSWGGYATLATITQTDRFGAAVMRGGYGDPVTMTATLQASGFGYGIQLGELKFGGTVWEQLDRYQRNSSIHMLDRVNTPLLIIHGEAETTVPIFLADQTFAGLQRLGKEVEDARYANENHNESRWAYANQRDYLTRMIGWFETHIGRERDARPTSAPGVH